MGLWRGCHPSRGSCFDGRGWCALVMPHTSSAPSGQPRVFKSVPSGMLLKGTPPHLALPAQRAHRPVNKFSIFHTASINPGLKQLPGLSRLKFEREKEKISLQFSNDTKQYRRTKPVLPLFELCKPPPARFSIAACLLRPAPYLISLYCTRCLLTSKVSFTVLNTLIKILEAAWCKQ